MRQVYRELLKFSEHRRDPVSMSCMCRIDPEDLVCRLEWGCSRPGEEEQDWLMAGTPTSQRKEVHQCWHKQWRPRGTNPELEHLSDWGGGVPYRQGS